MPFGEELGAGVGGRTQALKYSYLGADAIRQRFTGYEKDDETGLDFAEARMYENRLGRFTAVDPLLASGKSANPQTFNRYVYVGNNPILLSDPSGLDPWWKGNCNKDTNRCDYREAKDKPTDGTWEAVTFNDRGYATVGQWNDTGRTAYLYSNGGQDWGTRARFYENSLETERLANGFNNPKLLAIRHPEVAEQGGAPMAMGAPILNIAPGTYNLGAWGANKFGFNLPHAPTLEPDENTPALAKGFYYGTNVALLAEGGVSAFRGIASGNNTIRSGGLSFSAFKAAQGGTETLGHVLTTNKAGAQVTQRISTEFSHMFITQRMQRAYNLPNWVVNNRVNVWKLNTIQHSIIDGYRFQFLRNGMKSQVCWTCEYNWFTKIGK